MAANGHTRLYPTSGTSRLLPWGLVMHLATVLCSQLPPCITNSALAVHARSQQCVLCCSWLCAGRTRITLRGTGEVYTLVPPNAMVHNIVIGRTWIDAFGDMYIGCPSTGATCILNFQRCGWFGSGRYTFAGYVVDKAGVKQIKVR